MTRSITINEIDGSELLPICRVQREWLVEQYKLEEIIALKFFSSEVPVVAAIEHVRVCSKCRAWINRVIPEDVLRRQNRLARYCCANMFVAVEETGAHGKNKISFELFRGDEPCWKIGGVRSFISFCPWCGKKLPDQPFISDQ